MEIPFLDLKNQYQSIKAEINFAIKRVLDNQIFILGNELKSFEQEFARYLNVKYVVGVASGTDALILALRSLGIKKGDEVITPTYSFIATTLAITEIEATPVFVDIDPNTYETDIKQIKTKITKKTKAILPVHLYGAPCEIDKIIEIAKKNNIYVVEDACQSHGATLNGKMTGTFGDIGVFSFYPGKNLGAYGDGGAIVTNSKQLYEKLLKLRNYGQTKKYHHDSLGVNSRLDEIQAAVLKVKLKYLNDWNIKRNNIAGLYKKLLNNIKIQVISKKGFSNYHVFVIETMHRDKLASYLLKNGVHTLIHYPVPIHLQKCYTYLNYKKGSFPVAEKVSQNILSIPMYSSLKIKEIEYICKFINQFTL